MYTLTYAHTDVYAIPSSPPSPKFSTHNISTNASDEIDESCPQPADGPLYLEPNVQLDGHDEDDMNNSKVDKDGEEEPPELVGVREVGGPRIGPHVGPVETTDSLETVDLQTAATIWVEIPAACITLDLAGHETQPSDGDAAGMEVGRPNRAGAEVVGNVGDVPLVDGAIDSPRETGTVLRPYDFAHIFPVLTAPTGVRIVAVELGVPRQDFKVPAHARRELGSDCDQFLWRQSDPEVDSLEVGDTLRGVCGVGAQRGKVAGVPDGSGTNGGNPSVD